MPKYVVVVFLTGRRFFASGPNQSRSASNSLPFRENGCHVVCFGFPGEQKEVGGPKRKGQSRTGLIILPSSKSPTKSWVKGKPHFLSLITPRNGHIMLTPVARSNKVESQNPLTKS